MVIGHIGLAVALGLREYPRYIFVGSFGLNCGDWGEPQKQHVVRIAPFAGPFSNGLVAVGFWSGALGIAELLGVALPAGLPQLRIDELTGGSLVELD